MIRKPEVKFHISERSILFRPISAVRIIGSRPFGNADRRIAKLSLALGRIVLYLHGSDCISVIRFNPRTYHTAVCTVQRIFRIVGIRTSFRSDQNDLIFRLDFRAGAALGFHQPVNHIFSHLQNIGGKPAVLSDAVFIIERTAAVASDLCTVFLCEGKLCPRPVRKNLLVQDEFRMIGRGLLTVFPVLFRLILILENMQLRPAFDIGHGLRLPLSRLSGSRFLGHIIIFFQFLLCQGLRKRILRSGIIPLQIGTPFRLQVLIGLLIRDADFHSNIGILLGQAVKGHCACGIRGSRFHKIIDLCVLVPPVKRDHRSRQPIAFIRELVFPGIIIFLMDRQAGFRLIHNYKRLAIHPYRDRFSRAERKGQLRVAHIIAGRRFRLLHIVGVFASILIIDGQTRDDGLSVYSAGHGEVCSVHSERDLFSLAVLPVNL